ncbi:MAG: GAF domain-containing protein, partial [Anaerolineales bacterium]|nr:GAF domain-containing protein [Anaerolineales bacterium]
MKKSFLSLPENISPQGRNAFRVALVMLGVVSTAFVFLAFQVTQTNAWQPRVRLVISVFLFIIGVTSLRLTRSGRHERGIWLLFVPLSFAIIATSALFSGLGPALLIFGVVIFSLVGGQTLTSRQSNRMLIVGIATGIAALLVDLYIPIERADPGNFRTLVYTLVGIMLVVFGYVTIREFRNYSMRVKMIIAILVITTLLVVSVGGFLLYSLYNTLAAQTTHDLNTDVTTDARNIVDFQNSAQSDVLYLSQITELTNYLDLVKSGGDPAAIETTRASLENDFYSFAQARLIYDQIRFIDTAGQEIVRVNTSRDGVSTIVPHDQLQNKADRGYFKNSIGIPLGSIYISALDLNVEQGMIEEPHKPVIRYATPVYRNNKLQGIVITNILAENFLAPLGAGSGSSILVDADGYYLYNQDEIKRWGRDLKTEFTVAQDYPEFALQLVSGGRGSYNDGKQLFSYTPITLPGENAPRWYLASLLSTDAAFAPARQAYATGMVLMLLSLLVATGLILFLGGVIAGPLVSLTGTAEKVAGGDLNIRSAVQSTDEVGVLATMFNHMTAQLRESFATLEARVAERTRNLELAAEVGRAVSQVRSLDVMLTDAVELIRKQFDLYYTQVYLVNPSQTYLTLQAGTGEVGKELLERSHRLPFNAASINGRAAIEKKSVIISDTASSVAFKPNPLLPNTRSEMAVPLMIGEKVVGVLDMQSEHSGSLSADILPAFEALAGQLAIAIQNATFLAEAQQARAEVEVQAQRLSRANWTGYMDAIHKSEEMGFVFEQDEIAPLIQEEIKASALVSPIIVADETLGNLIVELEGQSPISQTDELLKTVAQQVAQQIENLRLLDSAERYRAEAEESSRRLTREGWDDYLETATKGKLSYMYDLKDVKPYNGNGSADASSTE